MLGSCPLSRLWAEPGRCFAQEHLGLSGAGEVEEWLVRGMGKKLVEGQMDQVQQQVTITKASHRSFGPDDWQRLHKQLAAWKVWDHPHQKTLCTAWMYASNEAPVLDSLGRKRRSMLSPWLQQRLRFVLQVSVSQMGEVVQQNGLVPALGAAPRGVRA